MLPIAQNIRSLKSYDTKVLDIVLIILTPPPTILPKTLASALLRFILVDLLNGPPPIVLLVQIGKIIRPLVSNRFRQMA